MEKYYRADGLEAGGMDELLERRSGPIVATKKTTVPIVGATWKPAYGVVWHSSEDAMRDRLGLPRCIKLEVAEIDYYEHLKLSKLFKDADFHGAYPTKERFPRIRGGSGVVNSYV